MDTKFLARNKLKLLLILWQVWLILDVFLKNQQKPNYLIDE